MAYINGRLVGYNVIVPALDTSMSASSENAVQNKVIKAYVDSHSGGGGGTGADGKSAYEIAVENGYTGTEAQWLESLHGADGTSPTASVSKSGNVATITITDRNGTTTATVSDGASADGDTETRIVEPDNILNLNQNWTVGKTFATIDGVIQETDDEEHYSASLYSISDYIPVKANSNIITSRLAGTNVYVNLAERIVQYDAEHNPIPPLSTFSPSNSPAALAIGSATQYIRIAAITSYLTAGYEAQINYGTTRKAYSAYFAPYTETIPASGNVTCWGDSLTHGTGASDESGDLIGWLSASLADRTVHKCGFPGDNSIEIAGYQGGMPLIAKAFKNGTAVTIPATGSVQLDIYSQDLYDGYTLGSNSEHDYPFRFPSICATNINPVTIAGVEGTLDLSAAGNDGVTRTFTFTRLADGDAVQLFYDTPILTKCSADYRRDISIIWVGTNGGWNDASGNEDVDILINQIRSMINYSKNSRYIVIGLTTGTDATRNATDLKMLNAFGAHFVNARRQLVDNGIASLGRTIDLITRADTDEADIAAGRVPGTLRYIKNAETNERDGTHLNEWGYMIVANLVYVQGRYLGYWD